MKKEYISPQVIIEFEECEAGILATSHDIQTEDNNGLNGGGTLGETPGINWGTDPSNPEDGYDPGEGGLGDGDLL